VMPRFPQVKQNISVASKELPQELIEAVNALNTGFDGNGRVLVRPSGTEPVVRVLAEAETEQEAEEACGTISALVRRELG
jgi:phosphoglucosamine mutase